MAIVTKEKVIDSWSVLIGGRQGRAEEIFGSTDNFITETKAPNVKKERKKLALGIIRGLFGTNGLIFSSRIIFYIFSLSIWESRLY